MSQLCVLKRLQLNVINENLLQLIMDSIESTKKEYIAIDLKGLHKAAMLRKRSHVTNKVNMKTS